MTLYLKYRPQKIEDLDLKTVRDQLKNILSSKSFPHAFLFSGVRGTGKTSSARIIAKAINCQSRIGIEPCNQCQSCIAITSGSSTDVFELDAASNRGIDDVRSLRDQIKLSPMVSKYKIFIIDEVHMLTLEAANALLKTLEEPPEHAIFILCTTDPEKLPSTVVSRCMQIKFNMPTILEISDRLMVISKAEKFELNNEIIDQISKSAKGSFRDAVKFLEQVAISGDTKSILGLSVSSPKDFLSLVRTKDRDSLLAQISHEVESGSNIKTFVENLISSLRQELLQSFNKSDIVLITSLEKVYEQMKFTSIPQLPLEIFVIEICEGQKSIPIVTPPEDIKTPTKVVEIAPAEEFVSGIDRIIELNSHWANILKLVKPKNHSVDALLRSTKPQSFDGKNLVLEVFYSFHKDKLETDKCRRIVEEAVESSMNISSIKLKLVMGKKSKPSDDISGVVADDIISAASQIFGVEAV